MKWSDSTTFAFVEEYLQHDCLYNSKSFTYRNKSARDAALIKISKVMNIPDFGPKEVVAKIKSIRSTYSQEIKKINDSFKSGAPREEVHIPKLRWFKLYHDVMKDKNLTAKECQSYLDYAEVTVEGPTSYADESDSQEVPCSSKDTQDTPKTAKTVKRELPKKTVYSRKRKIKCLENLTEKVNAVGEMLQHPIENFENEFDIFGRSVAVQLNAMPLMLALQAQSHIQNYLSSIRIHNIADPLNLQTNSPSLPVCKTYISIPSPNINNSVAEVSLDSKFTMNLQGNPLRASSSAADSKPSPVVVRSSVMDSKNDDSIEDQSNDPDSD